MSEVRRMKKELIAATVVIIVLVICKILFGNG